MDFGRNPQPDPTATPRRAKLRRLRRAALTLSISDCAIAKMRSVVDWLEARVAISCDATVSCPALRA